MLTLAISKLRFPAIPLTQAITATLYYKEYYSGPFILIASGVGVDVNGNITDSPLPSVTIDATQNYVLKAVNELCGLEYFQPLFINAYCPIGYTLSEDQSVCFATVEVDATPPSSPENSIEANNDVYTSCGSFIYHTGYNVNGTGTSDQITTVNSFWVNGPGDCGNNTLTDGPLNRSGLWATTLGANQDIGFSVCINLAETNTYYIGIGCDNFGIIRLDGTTVVSQDAGALDAQYGVGGACFKVWHIYPVQISAGEHVIECIGHNDGGAAGFGAEIYNNTPAEIIAATGYGDLNIIFSTIDFIGMPIQLGSGGIGFSCPSGYALVICDSPVVCRLTITTPVLY